MSMRGGNLGFTLALIAVSAVAGLAGYGLYHYMRGPAATAATGAPTVSRADGLPAPEQDLLGQLRPEFVLPDLAGTPRNINQWSGKVLLVNFWATWCPPCRKEMPSFIALKEQYGAQGFEIVGVAIDDPQEVQDFIDTLGVNYPVLVGALDASEIAKQYGNRYGALPYSVLIDRNDRMRFIQPGELTHETLERELKALL